MRHNCMMNKSAHSGVNGIGSIEHSCLHEYIIRKSMGFALCLVIMMLLISAVNAAPFDSGVPEFSFHYGINGFSHGSWFDNPMSLALDQQSSLIYVADMKADKVDAFSFQGIPKFQYGVKNGLKAPLGIVVDRRRNVYVSENAGGPIKIIDIKGAVTTLDIPVEKDDALPMPGRMTIDQDGNLYVVERANSRIYVFDKDLKFKLKFGGVGNERGMFKMLTDIAVDRQGRIYALDAQGIPVQVFDTKGNLIYQFGTIGDGDQDLSRPAGIFIDRNDQIWIADKDQHAVKVFARSGIFLRKFGDYGLGEGMLFYPVDVALDNAGRVYVLESGSRRLQVFALKRPLEPFNIFSQ
ncbi:MAG: NHL repeat-containing protein [Armatimonadota bacterium]